MKAVIFDADFTLYDPEADRAYRKKFDYLAAETGIDSDRLSDAWQEEVKGSKDRLHRKELIERVLERTGTDPSEELVEEAYDLFWDTVIEDLVFADGLQEMLERLEERFEVLAIATDELPGALELKLSTVFDDPGDIFDDFVTPRDTGEMKPSKDFYHGILERHGLEASETVMVGDSWRRDLEPAQELDMTTVLVSGEEEGEPDHRIESIMDLEPLLERIS